MAFSDIKDNSLLLRLFGENTGVNSAFAVIASAVITLALVFSLEDPLSSIEERAGSVPWLLASDKTREERIAIVSIDERSIAEVGPWPWSWGVIADLVTKINDVGNFPNGITSRSPNVLKLYKNTHQDHQSIRRHQKSLHSKHYLFLYISQ